MQSTGLAIEKSKVCTFDGHQNQIAALEILIPFQSNLCNNIILISLLRKH